MNPTIEHAKRQDLPAMADLLHELFTLESDFQPERDRQLRGLQLIIDTPALGQLFVLRVNGNIVGMANALITISTALVTPVVLLEDMMVSRAYRGKGLGRLLVSHICEWAKAQGMGRITLLADEDNIPALSFYAKLGFEKSAMVVRRKLL